jgi:hypothetical protein
MLALPLIGEIRSEGFSPSLADPDVSMRKILKENIWEYICAYVDDLAIAMKYPKSFIDKLKADPTSGGLGYQIIGDGLLTFHLDVTISGTNMVPFAGNPRSTSPK